MLFARIVLIVASIISINKNDFFISSNSLIVVQCCKVTL
jgi:hypothetical protein